MGNYYFLNINRIYCINYLFFNILINFIHKIFLGLAF